VDNPVKNGATGGAITPRNGLAGLSRVTVGLGWDPNVTGGAEFDLDASAIALTADERALSREFFVYFNNLSTPRGEIRHQGDNLTGEYEDDDERIDIRLDLLPPAVVRIVFAVTIYGAQFRRQSFGDVRNAYIRVVDTASGAELARFDLSRGAAGSDAMLFGEVYRDAGGWLFRGLGHPREGGLTGIARSFGIDV
jgi:tellurium resistance protein TerD